MKTNLHFTIIMVFAALTLAASAGDTENTFSPKTVAHQRLADYARQLDDLVRPIREPKAENQVPDAEALVDLRTSEYQLVWFWQNGLLPKPPLMVPASPLKKREQLPGRILELRLGAAGCDVFAQGLDKQFRLAGFDGRKGTITTFTRVDASTNFPPEDDFVAANAYATYLVCRREWADAARHFEAATATSVRGGTSTREWEFSNFISAAWAHLLAGRFEKSRAMVEAARRLPLKAEVPQRARFLLHFYYFHEAPPLAAEWEASLPK